MTRRSRFFACALALAAAFWCLFAAATLSATPTPETVMWTPVKDALFQIDSKPVKLWSLYYVRKDKKEQRFLLQIGTRYLMIDTQLRQITEYDPAAFTKKGNEYEMPRDARGLKALPSEDWILRDRGTAFVIHWKLKEEGRVLEIELPKMPDFRNVLW
jgi:hypothetical protein